MLEQLMQLLDLFLSEVQYDKATFRECCERVAFFTEGELQHFFERLCEDYEEDAGTSFLGLFRTRMNAFLESRQIKETEREIFLDAFKGFGKNDRELTVKVLKGGQEKIARRLALLENGKREKCRLSVGLGTMGGLFLLILLM